MKEIIISLLLSLDSHVSSRLIIASLFLLIGVCTLLYFVKTILSRRVLVIIDETRTSVDTDYRTLIQKLSEKHFKVSYKYFKGESCINLEVSKSQYHKVIVLAAVKDRRQDSQTKLYRDLQNIWRKDLIIFYLDSEGLDYSLTNFQAAQVNLCLKDYSKKKVNENLESFFNVNFFEEFRGIICLCILGCLFALFLGFIELSSPVEESVKKNQTEKEIDHSQSFKNAAENFERLEFEIINNLPVSLLNSTDLIRTDYDNSTFEILNDNHNQKDENATRNEVNSSEGSFYGGLGQNDKIMMNELNNMKILLEDQLPMLQIQIKNHSKQIEELTQSNQDLQKQNKELTQSNKDFQKQSENQSKQIEELTQSSQDLQKQTKELTQSSQNFQERLTELESLTLTFQIKKMISYLQETTNPLVANILDKWSTIPPGPKWPISISFGILIFCLLMIVSYNIFIYSLSSAILSLSF